MRLMVILGALGTAGLLHGQSQTSPLPILLPGVLGSGLVTVSPQSGMVGEFGVWKVTYRAGEGGIRNGGGLRVQLPEFWHAGPAASAFRIQSKNPRGDNFVTAVCSNPAVSLRTVVEKEDDVPDSGARMLKPSTLTGHAGFYVFITRVVVTRGELHDGDTLAVVYGDGSQGGRGARAGLLAGGPEPVTVGVDVEGRGEFRLYAAPPEISLKPQVPVEMLLTARSNDVAGETGVLHLALLDPYQNPATGFSGDVQLSVKSGGARIPSRVHVEAGKGWAEVPVEFTRPGVVRIAAREATRMLNAVSNPVEVLARRPGKPVYWGDLHSHSRRSGIDGLGREADAYSYARHISGLDFYALTDCSGNQEVRTPFAGELSAKNWPAYRGLADRYSIDHEFVTLPAFEADFGAPDGHHIVYFRSSAPDLPLVSPDENTLAELWRMLKGDEALTIPVQTLKDPALVDWANANNPDLRRNFEIYSAHGQQERYDTNHPLAFEQTQFATTPTAVKAQDPFNMVWGRASAGNASSKAGMSAQRAWEEGYPLSVVAGSDDHRSHPGQPQLGLTAVRAGTLTRQGIFDALRERHTWATTGARIILDFDVNAHPMGSLVTRGAADPVLLRVRVLGTDILDRVEILRHCDGKPGYQVIHDSSPARDQVEFTMQDRDPAPSALYYLRVRQRHLVRGRVAMAWSSPVWVRTK